MPHMGRCCHCGQGDPYETYIDRLCDFKGFSPTTLDGQLSTLEYESSFWPGTLVFPVSFTWASGVSNRTTVITGLRYEWSDLQSILGASYSGSIPRQTLRRTGRIDAEDTLGRMSGYLPTKLELNQSMGYVQVLPGIDPEERNQLEGRPIRFRIGYAQALKNGTAIGPVTTVSSTSSPTTWADANSDGLSTTFIRANNASIRYYGGYAFSNVSSDVVVEDGDILGMDIWLVCDHGTAASGVNVSYEFSTQLGAVTQPVSQQFPGVQNWYSGATIKASPLTLYHKKANWILSWEDYPPSSSYWPGATVWQDTLPDDTTVQLNSRSLPKWCVLTQQDGVYEYAISETESGPIWKVVLDVSKEMPTISIYRPTVSLDVCDVVYHPEQDEVYPSMAIGSTDGPHEQGGWDSTSDILFKMDVPPTVTPSVKYSFPSAILLKRP